MADDEDMTKSYAVGYKRPPKKNQFPKGVSGNPRGCPPRLFDQVSMMREQLQTPRTVKINGELVTMTSAELVLMTLVNQAIMGKGPAQKHVLTFMDQSGLQETIQGVPLGTEEQRDAIMKAMRIAKETRKLRRK